MIHSNTHIPLDLLMSAVLLLTFFGMQSNSNKTNCTRILALNMLTAIFACVCDAFAFIPFPPAIPSLLQHLILCGYWFTGNLVIILFTMYCYAFLKERGDQNGREYLIPIAFLLAGALILITLCATGKMYTIEDGVVTHYGHRPLAVTLLSVCAMSFLALLGYRKRKIVGIYASVLMSIFGLMPFIPRLYATLTGFHDYTYLGVGFAMLVAYHFVDNKVTEEKSRIQQQQVKIAMEKAVEANRAKTSFLFNMSHDIRTPMNAIIGFTNLLRKHQEDAERRVDYLEKIDSSSRVLLSIINNVLEMARIEKGTLIVEEKVTDVCESTETLTTTIRDLMKEKDITLTYEFNVEHRYLMQDATKVMQVFNNILSNAYKYTEPGGKVHVKVDELPSDKPGTALIRTTVSDTGIGMSEDFLPHLFEEFSRENNSTANKIEGTGLGMPIVKRLVELLHGTIEVQSQKGLGSTFIVTIPHRIVDQADTSHDPLHEEEVSHVSFEGKHILLAEDNDLNAEIVQELLQEMGFQVDHAADGDACVDMLRKAPANLYNIILMDIQMPKMNGYEATRKIREMADPVKAHIPILALSANAFEEDCRRSLEAGMNGHLAKPINVTKLTKALARNLSNT